MSTAIELTPDLDDWVDQQVRSGRHVDSSDVIQTALRLYRARLRQPVESVEELKERVAEGLADERAGRIRTFDRQVIEDIAAGRLGRDAK